MKLKFVLLPCFVLLSLVQLSCKNGGQNQAEATSTSLQNDLTGQYEGTLPCQDCDEISMALSLQDNQTFRLIKTFKGGSKDGEIETKMGRYSREEDASKIVLDIASKQAFLVDDNRLFLLNDAGRKIDDGSGALSLDKTR